METCAQPRLYCGTRRGGINGDGPPGNFARVHIPQSHVGIGNGRLGSAPAIAGRSGDRTRTPRTDAQRAPVVYPGQTPPARADLDNIVRGNTQRIASALTQSPGSIDSCPNLTFGGFNSLPIFYETRFDRCSAHIKRNGLRKTDFPS